MYAIILLLFFIGQISGKCHYNDPTEDLSGPQYRYGCEDAGGCWTHCNEGKGWCFTGLNCISFEECNINMNCVSECFPNQNNDHGPLKFRHDCGKRGTCWTWCLGGQGWCYNSIVGKGHCKTYKDCNIDDQCAVDYTQQKSNDPRVTGVPQWRNKAWNEML